ncbi:hypothetical protein CYLTODRAFT_427733 [Cylindrobasidium torrendii FP15055 ss-10]|uniref:Uncharacterized protein n=1 Tax=Cylindrobasidium torrendii FP15055 ss-10 TaxID=1314674 RepID=A0A0D7ARU7_9AGAR|nr:hypothetical protein CYLTODRAFT_427733 [Cylindrobasidium torrendii FP15055 ss-10]
MYGFTIVSTVCGWCLATSNYSDATAVSNLSTCSLGVVVFLADVILTSRCGTIWMYNIWIIIPPLIGILLEVVLYTLSIWGMADPFAVPIYFNPGLVSAVYFPFISLISTFYCTIVIAIRMVQQANRDRRNGGVAQGKLRATLTIIVESALLYSLTLVADVVAAWKVYQQEAPLIVVMYTTSALLYFAGMCPTCIMMRAMSAPDKKSLAPSAKVEIDLTEGELPYHHLGP